jgi:hypothetical protein
MIACRYLLRFLQTVEWRYTLYHFQRLSTKISNTFQLSGAMAIRCISHAEDRGSNLVERDASPPAVTKLQIGTASA